MSISPDSRLLSLDSVPKLWRLARLEYDRVRQRPVLLYPEGAVLLNDTGFAILELCNGSRTVAEIVSILSERYRADVSADVTEYLDRMADRELVRAG
ncbi:MAG TPA: pyrroloquinoline quinone biosynthesis peptide chaperone PqqD [Gemmatimonadales bacterium]|nr:pyrroloquinoline quinone biosynthesis peptide chaperone PqqD [Gemmatimonadales bacterium]